MSEPRSLTTALMLALLAPMGVQGQVVSRVEAGTVIAGPDGAVPMQAMRVAPDVHMESGNYALSARGSAWLTDQTWSMADGSVDATVRTPIAHGFHAEVRGGASRAFDIRSLGTDQIDAHARFAYQIAEHGAVWIGGGIARPWRIAALSSVDVAGAGASTRYHGATFSGTYTNFFFSRIVGSSQDSTAAASAISCSAAPEPTPPVGASADRAALDVATTGGCRRFSHFSDLEGSVRWEAGILELTARTGVRFGDATDVTRDSRRWSAASATLWLTNRIATVLGGGRIPANPARGMPARSYANVGIMIAYAPMARSSVPVAPPTATVRSFQTQSGAPGLQRVLVRVGGVESVEVMGDFSDWESMSLVRRGRDLWELAIPMTPGVHHINIRIDNGPWLAPPGLPTARDGFGGETGILVVQAPGN